MPSPFGRTQSRVKRHFPQKWVTAVFPPGRVHEELTVAAGGHKHINKAMLMASQFDDSVFRNHGHELCRPDCW